MVDVENIVAAVNVEVSVFGADFEEVVPDGDEVAPVLFPDGVLVEIVSGDGAAVFFTVFGGVVESEFF